MSFEVFFVGVAFVAFPAEELEVVELVALLVEDLLVLGLGHALHVEVGGFEEGDFQEPAGGQEALHVVGGHRHLKRGRDEGLSWPP